MARQAKAKANGHAPKGKMPLKKGGAKKKAAEPRAVDGRKASEPAGVGHNLTSLRRELRPFYEKFAQLKTKQSTANGEFGRAHRTNYESASDKTGIKRKFLRKIFAEKWALDVRRAEYAEVEPDDQHQIDMGRAAIDLPDWDETPLGRAAASRNANGRTKPQPKAELVEEEEGEDGEDAEMSEADAAAMRFPA